MLLEYVYPDERPIEIGIRVRYRSPYVPRILEHPFP